MINLLGLLIQNLFITLAEVGQIVSTFPVGRSLAQTTFVFDDYSSGGLNLFYILKLVAFGITIIAGFIILVMWNKLQAINKKNELARQVAPTEVLPGGPIETKWQEIMRHVESIKEAEWKFAVIEADQLVDQALKNLFPGDTMGERMMNIDKTQLLSIDTLWEAHKVRNNLAHNPNYFLRHAEAYRAIKLYETTLKELQVID